ncbi:MAG: tetratricopeptide repeat protein [Rhodoferax sp.]
MSDLTPSERSQLVALFNAGRCVELEGQTRSLVECYPESGFAWRLLGVSLQLQGKDGLQALQKASQLSPSDVSSHSNLGHAFQALNRFEEAVASFGRALGLQPDSGELHFNLANCLQRVGRAEQAAASFHRALSIKPDYVEALYNLGNVLRELMRYDESVAIFRRTLAIKPDFVQARNGLGNSLRDLGQLGNAAACYRQALIIRPHDAGINHNLGAALESLGLLVEARECFERAYEMGATGDKFLAALMLPPIMGTRQELSKDRAQFEQNVNALIENPVRLDDPLTQVGRTNFFLAYHGLNDRDLQVKIAQIYEKACPALLYQAPHCSLPKSTADSKIRVGFISKFIHEHSVSRSYSGLVEALAGNEYFKVTLISNSHTDVPNFVDGYPNFAGERVHLPLNLGRARAIVSALQLDVLCYLDIGMEPFSYFMAFARLARIQCVLGGHPVTTGIGNMDFFMSIDSMESENADEHYSEKLVRFRNGLSYFERPPMPTRFKTREELGFPTVGHIYMCPMKLQKIHPDFDQAIERILQIDVNGVVVLFQDHQVPNWHVMLAQRFERTISSDVRNRILFLPWIIDYFDFISANLVADVVLDPFHFGIGSTVIATFAVGTPIVTKPSDFLRGRVGLGFCKMLELPECVADSTEEYARRAVQIATDPVLRQGIQAKILANGSAIYQNLQPVSELVGFFENAINGLAT